MSPFRTEIGRHIEALADRVVLATVPALAVFMALAMIRIG
jgi:hypothetical protein